MCGRLALGDVRDEVDRPERGDEQHGFEVAGACPCSRGGPGRARPTKQPDAPECGFDRDRCPGLGRIGLLSCLMSPFGPVRRTAGGAPPSPFAIGIRRAIC